MIENFFTRFCRAAMMGLAWAAAWIPVSAVGGRLMVGQLEPEHIGGPLYAGFICGTIFSALAGIASGRRRLGELSFAHAVTWGALSGLLVGALPFVIGDQHAPGDRPLWVLPAVVISSMTVLGALSALVSLPIARWINQQNAHEHLA